MPYFAYFMFYLLKSLVVLGAVAATYTFAQLLRNAWQLRKVAYYFIRAQFAAWDDKWVWAERMGNALETL